MNKSIKEQLDEIYVNMASQALVNGISICEVGFDAENVNVKQIENNYISSTTLQYCVDQKEWIDQLGNQFQEHKEQFEKIWKDNEPPKTSLKFKGIQKEMFEYWKETGDKPILKPTEFNHDITKYEKHEKIHPNDDEGLNGR